MQGHRKPELRTAVWRSYLTIGIQTTTVRFLLNKQFEATLRNKYMDTYNTK